MEEYYHELLMRYFVIQAQFFNINATFFSCESNKATKG